MAIVAIVIYVWAALWTALIAGHLDGGPIGKLNHVLTCVITGLFWPVTLPMHLGDL